MEASDRVQSLKLNFKFIAGEFEFHKITVFMHSYTKYRIEWRPYDFGLKCNKRFVIILQSEQLLCFCLY